MKYALDTNVAIAALNGAEPVLRRLNAIEAAHVLLPDMVVAELLYGALTSTRAAENLKKVERLIAGFTTVPFGHQVARRFAETKAMLRKRGLTKSDFDLAIACIAVVEDATLVTHDSALLDGSIVGLRAEDWLVQAQSS